MNAGAVMNEIISKGGVAQGGAYAGIAVSTYSIFGHTLQEWVYVATLLALGFGMICNAIKTRAVAKAAKKSLDAAQRAERGENESS